MDRSVYPHRPPGHQPHLRRRRHPGQLPVRQGRRGLPPGAELRLRPAAEDARTPQLPLQERLRPRTPGAEGRRRAGDFPGALLQSHRPHLPLRHAVFAAAGGCDGGDRLRPGRGAHQRPDPGQRLPGRGEQRPQVLHRHGLQAARLY